MSITVAHSGLKFFPINTDCNKKQVQHTSCYSDFQRATIFCKAIYYLKCHTGTLSLKFLDIIFDLEMTGERKKKTRECYQKMVTNKEKREPRKGKQENERWD